LWCSAVAQYTSATGEAMDGTTYLLINGQHTQPHILMKFCLDVHLH